MIISFSVIYQSNLYTFVSDEAFQKLCDGLFEKFKESPAHTDQQEWEPGQGVVSFYAKDQAWCRANIVTIEPTRAYVSCQVETVKASYQSFYKEQCKEHDSLMFCIEVLMIAFTYSFTSHLFKKCSY